MHLLQKMASIEEPSSESYTECYLFVDHSNLWITGQKESAKKLVDDTQYDKRYRVDLGKFLNLMAEDRHISKAFLYGSVPPPNDSVWKAAKQKNFDVKTFLRSGSGREKELDVAMAHDITKNLVHLIHAGQSENVVFITVTGDRDLKPPIEYALENNVPVELWSWDDAMACEFRRLANKSDLFTARKLDDVKKYFSYTAVISTRRRRDVDQGHAIVYRNMPRGKRYLYMIAGNIARLKRLFYITSNDFKEEDKQDLVIEFPNSSPDRVLKQLRKLQNIDYLPCSYPEYMSSLQPRSSQPISTSNKYEALGEIDEESIPDVVESSMSLAMDDITSSNDRSVENSDEVGEEDWITVVRKKAGKRTLAQKRREMPCSWGDHCAKASECPYLHTEYEVKLFAKYPKILFKFFKTTECSKKDKHLTEEQQKWCRFAHGDHDSWCRKCKMYGHLTDKCKG